MIYIGGVGPYKRHHKHAGAYKVHVSRYMTGNLAVILLQDGAAYAYLSVNVGGLVDRLSPDEFVLHHDIEAELAKELLSDEGKSDLEKLALGLFEDTGKRVSYGYVTDQPVWRLFDFEQRNKQWGV